MLDFAVRSLKLWGECWGIAGNLTLVRGVPVESGPSGCVVLVEVDICLMWIYVAWLKRDCNTSTSLEFFLRPRFSNSKKRTNQKVCPKCFANSPQSSTIMMWHDHHVPPCFSDLSENLGEVSVEDWAVGFGRQALAERIRHRPEVLVANGRMTKCPCGWEFTPLWGGHGPRHDFVY